MWFVRKTTDRIAPAVIPIDVNKETSEEINHGTLTNAPQFQHLIFLIGPRVSFTHIEIVGCEQLGHFILLMLLYRDSRRHKARRLLAVALNAVG